MTPPSEGITYDTIEKSKLMCAKKSEKTLGPVLSQIEPEYAKKILYIKTTGTEN